MADYTPSPAPSLPTTILKKQQQPSATPNRLLHSSRLRVEPNDAFLREEGTHRAWLLRGVNLSGSGKFPKHPVSQPSHVGGTHFLPPHPSTSSSSSSPSLTLVAKQSCADGQSEDADVNEKDGAHEESDHLHSHSVSTTEDTPISFVGRPFELDEADEHLARLRHWGFRMIRWVVTWEAIEHQGPGIYDQEFLDYTVKALLKAKEYGFKVMIDFHQDVWSRFSGGSGAPLWTFHLAGLDPHHFAATGAAAVHNTLTPDEPLLRMVWLTNYYKLACATMFTLFYAGKILAPKCTLDNGINIQDYLQQHFLNAIAALVDRIHACRDPVTNKHLLEDSVVIGYDSWNEPSCGWIGLAQLDVLPEQHDMRQGDMPTPFQSLMLGEGMVVRDVATYRLELVGPVKKGSKTLDPSVHSSVASSSDKTIKAWLTKDFRDAYDAKYGIRRDAAFPNAGACLWAQHGVWSIQHRTVLQQDYFLAGPRTPGVNGARPIDWVHDHWLPFAKRVIDTVRNTHRSAILFLEPPVYVPPPNLVDEETAAIIEGDEDDCVSTHEGSTRRQILPIFLRKDASGHSSHHSSTRGTLPAIAEHGSGTGALRRKKSKGHRHDHNSNTSLTTNMVYTPHHYDDLVLLTKKYLGWINIDLLGLSRGRHSSLFGSIVFGRKKTKALFGKQIHEIQQECSRRLGHRPVLIGETGLHFDVGLSEKKQAGQYNTKSSTATVENAPFKPTKQFQKAFDNILNGLDRNLVHYTLWNYTNENDTQYGDGWNGENLSLYSRVVKEDCSPASVLQDLDKGGRAVEQFCRPYPVATVGRPIQIEFDRRGPVFKLWTLAPSPAAVTAAKAAAGSETEKQKKAKETRTEIYVPRIHFPDGPQGSTVRVSDGTWEWDTEQQLLFWTYGPPRLKTALSSVQHEHWIEITRKTKPRK
ncbi:hypothetical protein BG005_007196 [Podila minutissima]|nr:hypothetical protein BG005_007196 [Podila minutissima]